MAGEAGGIDHLIINSPFDEPRAYWDYERERQRFARREGRRPAGYVMASTDKESVDDPGVFVPLPIVNQIRPRVAAWREAGYPGVTGVTKRLLEHWRDPEAREGKRFFFCQLEAIETLIWLAEAPAAERQGIDLPSDGGLFPRVCAKMATGSGKTVVMAMAIAWHVLNKVESPQDRRFAKHVLVVAPGLTVKNRLAVLEPANAQNYYAEFEVVPSALMDRLRQGRVLVRNWHALAWDSPERIAKKRSVDKRGAKSDEAYVRGVLGELASAKHLLVINDEAHHAWRGDTKGVARDEVEEATVWVGGLDRIHRARGILTAYDFSATPFVPSGKKSSDEALFGWIASDFGLSDAIEAGLVKTPRVVIRDDGVPNAKTYKSDLFHIFRAKGVGADLNRPAQPNEPLPDLVLSAYYLLGKDWLVTQQAWQAAGAATPPVMITVANRTETAARIHATFEKKRIKIEELCETDRLLHIDSKVLELAEEADAATAEPAPAASEEDGDEELPARKLTKQEQAELLRRTVDTVGRVGQPGERIQNVISVGMLSEGWDAKTVTHIMGLRAFTSQLLCEQVVGRGLRRTTYDVDPATGLFVPEFVNVFGVPFTFLPHEVEGTTKAEPPKPRTRIEPLAEKQPYEISWPNVLRIDHGYASRLVLDLEQTPVLRLYAHETPMRAELAPVVGGKTDFTMLTPIDLEAIAQRFRLQTITFQAAAQVFDQMAEKWPGSRESLLGQLVDLIDRALRSDRVQIEPNAYDRDPLRRRILLTLNMSKIVQHLFAAIRHENSAVRSLVLDRERPLRATGDMPAWYTTKPCAPASRSHISACVFDSAWEASAAQKLDHDARVAAWAKNDHLGFEVHYLFQGAPRRYRPDFLVRLANGVTLILEVKGQDSQQEEAKRAALDDWARAVNEHGGLGRWAWDVAFSPSGYEDVLERAASR